MSNARHGCFNRRPFANEMRVQDGYISWECRQPRVIDIEFRMSRECNYRLTELGRADPKCEGCRHRDPEPTPPAGYTTEELERDNPYNAWMKDQ